MSFISRRQGAGRAWRRLPGGRDTTLRNSTPYSDLRSRPAVVAPLGWAVLRRGWAPDVEKRRNHGGEHSRP